MIRFLPTELQILHNTGVFDYEKLQILLFAVQLALFPLASILIAFCIYEIVLKRSSIPRFRQTGLFIVTALSMALCFLIYPGIISKLYFARGHDRYLHHRDVEACDYYFKSLAMKTDFTRPLYGLIAVYQENPVNITLLKQIAQRADIAASDTILAQIGRLYEDNKNHIRSLEYYEKAGKINPEISYTTGIIRNLIALKNYSKAETEISNALHTGLNNPFSEDLLFFSSVIDFEKGSYKQSREKIEQVLNQNASNPLYFVHKARILTQSDDRAGALDILSHAILLKKELPEAYFEKARIYYSRRDFANTRDALERTLYYDNHNSLAFAMLQMVLTQEWLPLESLIPDSTIRAVIDKENDNAELVKGDITTSSVTFTNADSLRRFKIGLLEPYGFGLKSELITTKEHTFEDGNHGIRVEFSLQALRSSRVNLNRPWILNIVLVDIDSGRYAGTQLPVAVNPDENEEGKILFVITEDHERLGDFPSTDDTPDIPDVDPYEINTDLIQKSLFADKLADRYGIKWSHIIDIGSSFLRLKWIQDQHLGDQWDTVWDSRRTYLNQSIEGGHDVQLHIHAYGIPGNRLFRQYFDSGTNRILFKDNIVRPEIADDIHGAWSENYTDLGAYDKPDSRVGSILQGIQILEGELHETNPAYRTLFFRAGEYEFGSGEKSVGKSVLALQKNKILCDSDAITGSPFRRGFKFFERAGKNVYFPRADNIHERAPSLLDTGILEILPVAQINDHNYVRPVDSGKHIKFNYDLCLSDGTIRNDIFILMEMYHLGNTNWAHKWDRFDVDYEDWGRMDDHFGYIKKHCPRMEYVTISEAVKTYLDRYTPDVLALRTNEKEIHEKLFIYDVEFLGKEIEVGPSRQHYVSIKPPSYFLGRIDKIELIHNGVVVKTWPRIQDYGDLNFTASGKSGFKIGVYLN